MIEFDRIAELQGRGLNLSSALNGGDVVTLATSAIANQYGLAQTFWAGDGNDTVTGRDNHDIIYGGNHNDELTGGEGTDALYGGSGNDILNALDIGETRDVLQGNAGIDQFIVDNGDLIQSLEVGERVTYGSAALIDRMVFHNDGRELTVTTYDASLRRLGNITVEEGFSVAHIGNISVAGNAFQFSRVSATPPTTSLRAIMFEPQDEHRVLQATIEALTDARAGLNKDFPGVMIDIYKESAGTAIYNNLLAYGDRAALEAINKFAIRLDIAASAYVFQQENSKVISQFIDGKLTASQSAALLLRAVNDIFNTLPNTTEAIASGAVKIGTAILEDMVETVIRAAFDPLIRFSNHLDQFNRPPPPTDAPDVMVIQGNVSLSGRNGDDVALIAARSSGTVDGGAGHDQLTLVAGSSASDINLTTGRVQINGIGSMTIRGFESAAGNDGSDSITGNTAANRLDGRGGNDRLIGAAGNDTLNGGVGIDTLSGGTGNDMYQVDNTLDRVVEAAGGGVDEVRSSVNYTLSGEIERLRLLGSSDLSGTGNGSANTVVGNTGANRLGGLSGNDVLIGGSGNDVLVGGTGADRLYGGVGDDLYWVDNPADLIAEGSNQGFDRVQSFITLTLGANLERLDLQGTLNIAGTGNTVANTLVGNAGNNALNGLAGNDTLVGNTGNDVVQGGIGDDVLRGGAGNDRLIGDADRDSLAGGDGADQFVFRAIGDSLMNHYDTVTDFQRNQGDRMDLSAIDANANSAGNQAFIYIETALFSGVAGQIATRSSTRGTLVIADTDGDRAADFALFVNGSIPLTADCFVL